MQARWPCVHNRKFRGRQPLLSLGCLLSGCSLHNESTSPSRDSGLIRKLVSVTPKPHYERVRFNYTVRNLLRKQPPKESGEEPRDWKSPCHEDLAPTGDQYRDKGQGGRTGKKDLGSGTLRQSWQSHWGVLTRPLGISALLSGWLGAAFGVLKEE